MYSFPLTAAQFFSLLPIREMTFDLGEAMEIDETGAGEILTANLGTRLWQGEVQLGDMRRDEVADVTAMLDQLRRPGASFLVFDRAWPAPRMDPTGAALVGAAPVLHSVAANNNDIRIGGLSPGYQLRRHDYVGLVYSGRYGLHRLASNGIADATGVTPPITVSPPLPQGWALGAPLTLVTAACKAVIVPGSYKPGRHRGALTVGASFQWRQTRR